jgi:phage tail-like protein
MNFGASAGVSASLGGSNGGTGGNEPGNTYRFDVKVDGHDLGSFTAVDGLTAEYDIQTYEEGGQNSYVHKLLGRLKYQNIKVSRPLDNKSKGLAAWFSSLGRGQGMERKTATIIAYNDNQETVGQWNIQGFCPVKYTGPSFSADGAKVAIESIEFAHDGFYE